MMESKQNQRGGRTSDAGRKAILERAAQLFCDHGYEATSMQQVAAACGLTKAGLYHHVESKEALLATIMDYGMDVFDEQVYAQVVDIADPVERLKACMGKNVRLCTRGWSREITVVLHEHATLKSEAGKSIDARKKRYVRFLETSFAEAIERGLLRKVDPTIAAFSFLGMVLWIYKWFRTDGRLSDDQIADGMIDLFFHGLLPRPHTEGTR